MHDDFVDFDVDIAEIEGIEDANEISNGDKRTPPKSITTAIGGIFATIAAVRGKDFWKLSKKECVVLKSNEKSLSGIIPDSILSKLGVVSFAVVLISATIKRMLQDLREIRNNEEDYDEEEYEEDERVERRDQKTGRF